MKRICIVGGSIAGLTTALELKRLDENLDVTVFEEHSNIGEPVTCAEGFLALHGIEKPPDDCIDMSIEEVLFRFNFNGRPSRTYVVTPENGFWVIDRTKYERTLAEKCASVGVDIKTGHKASIEKIEPETDILVNASGADPDSGFFALQYTVNDDFRYHMDKALFEFTPDLMGYYWILPKGPDLANVGVCRINGEPPSNDEMEKMLKEYMVSKIIHGDIVKKTSGYIGINVRKRLYDEGQKMVYVGDAAGFASPLTNEGMSSAIFSAKAVSEAIVGDKLHTYKKTMMSELDMKHRGIAKDIWKNYGYETFSDSMAILCNMLVGKPADMKVLRKMFRRKPVMWFRLLF
ncbi:MAG: NAD(P)/FAD-dependent oxidoreductase [Halobacteriota archaeon]|nr:NAD(P)/FAD-dependent oxidoreductase [Halobacteriota archaeon]